VKAHHRAGLFFCAHVLDLMDERISSALGHAKLFAQPLKVRLFRVV
jgi:hypothetical protein